MELAGAQVLAVVLFLSLFLLPLWVGAVVIVAATAAFLVLADVLFPPVAAEPFGSVADAKRAAVHFWLAAPAALIFLILLIVTMLKG